VLVTVRERTPVRLGRCIFLECPASVLFRKVVPYLITSIGHRADPGFVAVSLQVALVINPVKIKVKLLSTRPTVTFPAKEISPLASTKLYCLVIEAHRCKDLAQGHYTMVPTAQPGLEPLTCKSQV